MRKTRFIEGLAQQRPFIDPNRRVFPYGMTLPRRSLMFEYRAESLLGADASGISEWPSFSRPFANPTGVSGTGNWAATQGTGGNQPIVKTNILAGYPVARFDGSNDFLNVPNTGSGMGTMSFFAVLKCTDAANRTVFAGAGSSAQIQIFAGQIYLVKVGVSILGNSTGTLNTTNFYTIGVTYDRNLASGNLNFHINGALDTSVNVTTTLTVGNLFIGGRGAGITEPFLGDVAHAAFYYSMVSQQELDRIHYVLRSMYGHY